MKYKLNKGDYIPYFTAKDYEGFEVSSDDLRGKISALYFYHKSDTTESIRVASIFRDAVEVFEEQKVFLIGVSPDTPESQIHFFTKHRLNFTLFADEDLQMCHAFDVLRERKQDRTKIVEPSFFVVSGEGCILFLERNFEIKGLIERMEEALHVFST